MEIEIQQKLDTYLRLLEAIEQRTHDRLTAAVLAEVAKDIRMSQMHQERRPSGDGPDQLLEEAGSRQTGRTDRSADLRVN